MSTKTTIKRVALVAVAALALGGFTAVSAKAAQSVAQSYLYCSKGDGGTIANDATHGATCNGVAGANNTVTLTGVQTTKDLSISVSGAGATLNTASNWTLNSTTAATSASIAAANATGSITVNTPQVGTITVSISYATAGSGIYTASTETVVITVAATASSGAYSAANTTAYLNSGETITATADATVTKIKTYAATDSATATIYITYLDGLSKAINKDTLTATITSGGGTLLTSANSAVAAAAGDAYSNGYMWDSRTVSNPTGYASKSNVGQSQNSINNYTTSLQADASGNVAFQIFANGQAGVTTVTVKNGAGTVITTKTLTFTGTDVSSITPTVIKSYVQGDTTAATHNIASAVLKDSAGNLVVGVTWSPTVTYSSALLGTIITSQANLETATSNSSGVVNFGWTPATAATYGPVTVTLTDPTTKASASFTITLSSAVASSFTVTPPASVDLGNPFSYTVVAKDANGYNVPDLSVASNYISSVTSNGGIGSADLTTLSTAGAWTLKLTGPTVAVATGKSDFLLTGTAGTANSYLAKTLTGTTVSSSFAVNAVGSTGGDAALALDAANAATDAANNAYDEAQNATQAAQDALAAVTALAAQVKSLIASVKSLTALVSKIKAKVGA